MTAKKLAVRKNKLANVNPFDQDVATFRTNLERRKDNRTALTDWLKESLVEGIDFGRLHVVSKSKCQFAARGESQNCKEESHWSKPIMFKPGAEKVCGMLGVTVHYPTLSAFEQATIDGKKIENIILRCELRNGAGQVVAEGVGARSVEKDYNDLNKSLKMAEKSAHIDATLRMGGLSELFTQDEPVIQEEKLGEEHILIFFNFLKDTGFWETDEKVNRQLDNLARALGHNTLADVPLALFDTCKAQLLKGTIAMKAKKETKP